MSLHNKLFSVSQFLRLFLLALLLSACASTPDESQIGKELPPSAFSELKQQPDWYLAQLAQTDAAYRFSWEILAARSLIAKGDLQQASAIQQQLAKEAYTPRQKHEQQLVAALLLNKQGQYAEALSRLSKVDLRPLSSDAVATYYGLRGDALAQQGSALPASQAYVSQSRFLQGDALKHNSETVWTLLSGLDGATLQQEKAKANSDTYRGWLALAGLRLSSGSDQAKFQTQFLQWQKQYPNHPASALFATLPSTPIEGKTPASLSDMPGKIAVFIPLSGNLAAHGDALRNGLLTGYKDAGLQGDMRFYDSASQTMPALYQQAQADGAEMIVGPLIKEQVESLLSLKPVLPVLALNEPNGTPNSPSLFYFALSPAADAEQAALKISQDNKRLPLILAPQGAQGQRVVDGFTSRWQQTHDTQPLVARFTDRQSLQAVLSQAMGVASSQQRIDSLQRTLGQKVFAQPFNRQDVDAIYLYASPLEAGIIKSFLDISQSPFAEPPTYYLGAKGNPGLNNPGVGQNVIGMQIGDMPWMLDKPSELRNKVTALWPQMNNDLLRFFAMGYDAARLIPNLSVLRADPNQQQPGLTGELSIAPTGGIVRNLSWVTYQNSTSATNAPASAATATIQP